MKVLFITKFHKLGAGDRTYTFELEKILLQRGHEVGHFAMSSPVQMPTPFSKYFVDHFHFEGMLSSFSLRNGVRVFFRSLYSFEAIKKLQMLIDEFNPDIAHIQQLDTHLTYSILPVLKKNKIPIVSTLHIYAPLCINYDLFDDSVNSICEACKKRKFYQPILKRCKKNSLVASIMGSVVQYFNYSMRFLRHMDAFICPTAFVRDKFIQWGFESKKLFCLPNFCETDNFVPNYENRGYGIYCGRITPEKGVEMLLEVLADTNIPFKFIGDGPLRNELIQRAGRIQRGDIEFIGFRTGDEYRNIVGNAMFVVVPSIWYEVFGLVIVEGYALGKPVIGSRIGGIPELIEDGRTGYLFEPGDLRDLQEKMLNLYNTPQLAKQMGKNARIRAETLYTPERHYSGLMEIYSSAMH